MSVEKADIQGDQGFATVQLTYYCEFLKKNLTV
jgi:hypothetical protein